MQKQSYELIEHMKALCTVHKLIYSNRFPVFLFLISAFPRALWKLIFNSKIQVVHANDGLMALFLTPLLWFTKRKLAVTIHGLDIVYPAGFYQFWVRKYLSKFHLIIPVSHETMNECIKRGIPKEKIIYVPNAVDLRSQGIKREGFREELSTQLGNDLQQKSIILSVGRPVVRKGLSWFLKNVVPKLDQSIVYIMVIPELKNPGLLKTLQKILPTKIFDLIVKGFALELDTIRLKQLVHTPDFKDRAFLMNDDHLKQLYLHADLYVMPNIPVEGEFEGFGLVMLEAASAGTVVLASDLDGIPSAIQDQETGYLLPSGDSDEWASTIERLLQSGDLDSQGQAFKENLMKRQYSWQEMSKRYLEAFESIA